MNQRGFAPILLLIGIIVVILIGAGGYLYYQKCGPLGLQPTLLNRTIANPCGGGTGGITVIGVKETTNYQYNGASVSVNPTPIANPNEQLGTQLFLKNKDLYSYDEQTGNIKPITTTNNVTDFNLNPDQKIVYLIQGGQLQSYNLATSQEKQLTNPNDGDVKNFLLSPDKQYIAFNTRLPTPLVVKTDGSDKKIIPAPSDNQSGYSLFQVEQWLPDSKHFIIRGHGQLDTTDNFYEADIVTKAVKQFDTYGKFDINGMPYIEYSPDGKYLAYIKDYKNIFMSNPDGSQAKLIFPNSYGTWFLWSPDSTKIAIQANSTAGQSNPLDVIDPTGKVLYQLINPQGEGFSNIVWSKDSRFIAVERYHTDTKTYTFVADKLIVIDLLNKTEKETVLALDYPTQENIEDIYFAPSYKIYYDVGAEVGGPNDQALPHLWVWDFINNTNTKISDFASLAKSQNSWYP